MNDLTDTLDVLQGWARLTRELQGQLLTLRAERDEARRALTLTLAAVPKPPVVLTKPCANCREPFAPHGRERVCYGCKKKQLAEHQARFKKKRALHAVAAVVLLLVAVPAAAEENPLKWSAHRPIADWLSTGLVAGSVTADVVHAWRAEDPRSALWGVACRNAVAGGGAELLKVLIHRWRPDHSDQKSTPSGHTAEAFANSTYASVTITMPVAAAVGYLRPAANRHYASDVAFGAGLGLLARKVCP